MHHYTILPKDAGDTSFEIRAADGSAALNLLGRTEFGEADVWQDGAYIFSVRKAGGPAKFWSIFRKLEPATPVSQAG